jgi:hypothetical protein
VIVTGAIPSSVLTPKLAIGAIFVPPDEEELLAEELELLELLDDEELEELLLDDEELLEDELELEELEELDELLDEELPLEVPSPTQAGAIKLPSWLPCTPKALLTVCPGAGSCQLQQLVNRKLLPGLVPVRVTFHWLVTVTCSGKFSVTVQPLSAVVPLFLTLTSTWKKVPPVFEGVAVQLYVANALPKGSTSIAATKMSDETDNLKPEIRMMKIPPPNP